MKYTSATLMGAFFSLVAGAPGLANDNIIGAPMSNYNIMDITWEVPISPERNITVVGTIEDVIRHLQQVAPEIAEARFPSASIHESNSALRTAAGASLNTPRLNNVTCGIDDYKAVTYHIETGVLYLRRLWYGPEMSPNACGRVSCSYDSAIYLCNDSPEHISLGSWGSVADAGIAILRSKCRKKLFISAQAFYDGWSVKAMGDKC